MSKAEVLSRETKPETPTIQPDNIPDILKGLTIWVVWNWVQRNGKWQKPPAKGCKSNDESTWMTYEQASSHYYLDKVDGVGVALSNGLCGIDLDDCIANGQFSLLAKDIIATMNCYWEISPSGTGVKLLFFGEKPAGPNESKAKTVEIYDSGRYFTITGHDGQGEIANRQEQLEAVYTKYVQLPDHPALNAMLRITPKGSENDGSKRLLAICCRAVEHNLTDDEALRFFRIYAIQYPFPKSWSDAEILSRIRQAEDRDDCERGSAKPIIELSNDNFPRTVCETELALSNSDDVYQKDGRLVRIERCQIAQIPSGSILEVLTKHAKFEKKGGKGSIITVLPPYDLRQAIMDRGDYPNIKEIKRVVNHPILLPDGDIVAEPSFNAETGLYLNIEGWFPRSMLSPQDAVAKLSDIFCDFPFRSDVDLAGIISIILTMLSRHLFDGATPVLAVDGNRSGCGKGYATETAISIPEGCAISRYSGGTNNQEELRKMLFAAAIAGKSYVLFDNVRGRFGGPVLEGIVTSNTVSDRVLGASKVLDVDANFTWVLTANNVVYTDDMPRRIVPIFLDSDLERPDQRDPSKFKYPNLKQHVRRHRNLLLIAALSIIAGYIKAGKPDQKLSGFGGFEEWSDLVRSALVWAGAGDCLANRDELFEAAKDSSPVSERLVATWDFNNPVTLKEALELIYSESEKHTGLRGILETKPDGVTDNEFLGKLLRSARGLTYGNRKLDHNGKGKPKWSVEKIVA